MRGQTPYFEALLANVEEDDPHASFRSVEILAKAGRREAIPQIFAYLLKKVISSLAYRIEQALDAIDPGWAQSPEIKSLFPRLMEIHRRLVKKEDKQKVEMLMAKIGDPSFAEFLFDAIEKNQGSYHTESALRTIAEKNNLTKWLEWSAERDRMRKETSRLKAVEEKKRQEENAARLKTAIRIGLPLQEVVRLLGKPAGFHAESDVYKLFGSVTVMSSGSSRPERSYYVWQRPEGEWKLVFVNGVVSQIYQTPFDFPGVL